MKAPVCQPAELDFAAEQLSLVMSEGQPVVSDEILTNDGLMLRVFYFVFISITKKRYFIFLLTLWNMWLTGTLRGYVVAGFFLRAEGCEGDLFAFEGGLDEKNERNIDIMWVTCTVNKLLGFSSNNLHPFLCRVQPVYFSSFKTKPIILTCWLSCTYFCHICPELWVWWNPISSQALLKSPRV